MRAKGRDSAQPASRPDAGGQPGDAGEPGRSRLRRHSDPRAGRRFTLAARDCAPAAGRENFANDSVGQPARVSPATGAAGARKSDPEGCARTGRAVLRKQNRNLGQNLVEDCGRYALQTTAMTGSEVERAHLVAADDAGRFCPGPTERRGKSPVAREGAAGRNGDYNRHSRNFVESIGGDDENGTRSLLLMPRGRVKGDKIDLSALHRISRPTGGASSQARSSPERGASALHCASNPSSV